MAPKQLVQQSSSAVNGAGEHPAPEDTQNNSSGASVEKSTYITSKPALAQDRPLKANREGVTDAFSQFGQLIHASRRPLPTQMGDGTYNEQKTRTGLRQDLKRLRLKGTIRSQLTINYDTDTDRPQLDFRTLLVLIRSKLRGEQLIDDRTMIMERVIQLVSNLPRHSKTRLELTDNFLNELWYSLDHPPLLYIGEEFQYRRADGSYNAST